MKTRFIFAAIFLGAVLITTPHTVEAQTADQLRQQIANLLAQISALQAQLTPANPLGPTAPVVNVPVIANTNATFQYSGCPNLQFNLERGDRDAQSAVEVTMLQRFLSQDRQIYPEGEITGYFGPATERAVQRFQVRHGIVTQGDYASTGYGRVGPRTRWAVKNSCGAVGPVTDTHAFTVTPIQGPIDLEVSATFEFTGLACTSYELDWGDGSVKETQQGQGLAGCSTDVVRVEKEHTYATPGTYIVTLRLGSGSLQTLPVIGRLTVTAQEKNTGNFPIDPNAKAYITFSDTQGSAPFAAGLILRSDAPLSCTSYEIDWGDGSARAKKEAGNSECLNSSGFSREFRHTYENAGVYTVRVQAGRGSLSSLPVIEQRVNVHSTRTGTDSSCFIEPNTGVAPHTVRARILLGGGLCDGNLTYVVDWGDFSKSSPRTCVDQNYHYEELVHTYISPAVYTARLEQSHPNAFFDEEVCTVNVSASNNNTSNNAVTNSCQSWTDGCNTCARNYIGGAAACTERYCLQKGSPQCYQYFDTSVSDASNDTLQFRILSRTSRTVEFTALINTARSCDGGLYTLYFGDTQKSPQPFPADACSSFEREITYKYPQDGTYTAVLERDGVVIEQVTVTIGNTSSAAKENMASVLIAIENFIRGLFK
ncbi:peptidoglycan-binding protein [Candidatus Kaiserbacteria bacterium]|nr:MAG: peptidoglycan-binding protein [Candidatus Kaiserbacteria bacterium]